MEIDYKQKLELFEKACAEKSNWTHAAEIIKQSNMLHSVYESAFFALLAGETDHPSVIAAKNRVHPSRYEGIVSYYRKHMDLIIQNEKLKGAS